VKMKKNILISIISIFLILLIAMALSLLASSYPDGLEKVAGRYGFTDSAIEVLPEDFFLIPDYVFGNLGNEYLQTSLAGLFGILIISGIFILVYFLYRTINRNRIKDRADSKDE